MTARSQRRAAELAVIEAARTLVRTPVAFGYKTRQGVVDALHALDALGLAEPAQARANACAPVTAQQAATWMNTDGKARSLHARIIRLLWEQGMFTTEEIESVLDGQHQTISPRINELRDAGWVYDSGRKRTNTSGREAIVWRLSQAAVQAIRGQESMAI